MDASHPADAAPPGDPADGPVGARVFVWALWAVMTAAGAYFITHCANNVPFWDEWELVPLLTGHDPMSFKTLWNPINEHRLPLVKLTVIGLWRATGDFRSQAWLNLALLSLTAAGLVLLARRLRGRTAYSDVFFPVALLHWGNSEFLTGTITLNHLLASVLQLGVMAVVVLRPGGLNRAGLAVLAACLLMLPLCGANGLPVVAAGCGWLGWVAVREWRDGRRWWAVAHLAIAAAAAGGVGVYFRGYVQPAGHPPAESVRVAVRTAAQALGMTCVGWQKELWPAVGFAVPVALVAGAVLALVGGLRKWPAERLRAPGLLLFLAAGAAPAAAIGWARAFLGPDAAGQPRYGVVLMPPVVAAYLAAVLYEGRAWRGLLPTALCLLTVAFLPGRMVGGWMQGQAVRERLQPLAWEGRAGATTDHLAEKYAGVAYPDPFWLEVWLRYLSGTKYGPLGKATAPDPRAYRTVSMPVPAPHTIVDMAGGPRRFISTGPDPYLVFLVHPEGLPAVRTVRITYRLKSLDGPVARAEVFWIRHDGEGYGYAETGRYWTRTLMGDGAPRTMVIPVDGPLKWLRIDPSVGPCDFEILDWAVTTPAPPEAAQAR